MWMTVVPFDLGKRALIQSAGEHVSVHMENCLTRRFTTVEYETEVAICVVFCNVLRGFNEVK
jgi:hypothetical protein